MDVRLARERVERLARWWTSATQEARLQLWQKAAQEGDPPFAQLRLAIILAETEAGETREG